MPTTRDLDNRITVSISLAPVSVTSNTTRNGTGVDTADKRYVEFVFVGGGVTDGTYTQTMQESDDNSTYTAVDSGRLVGTLTALSAGNLVNTIGVHPTKRYVRPVSVSTGTSTGAHAIGAIAIVGDS